MSLPVALQPNITTGDPISKISFTASIGFSGGTPTQPEVKAAIVSRDKSLMLIPSVVCVVSAFTIAGGIATIAGRVAFSALDTRNLLTTPSDLTSPLVKPVIKQIDELTGYSTALLEIQFGDPFFETWHSVITIGKGLIA